MNGLDTEHRNLHGQKKVSEVWKEEALMRKDFNGWNGFRFFSFVVGEWVSKLDNGI